MIFRGIKMEMVKTCPFCGEVLMDLEEERISFRNCNHYVWHSNLGSISNDEIVLNGGMGLRLLKR